MEGQEDQKDGGMKETERRKAGIMEGRGYGIRKSSHLLFRKSRVAFFGDGLYLCTSRWVSKTSRGQEAGEDEREGKGRERRRVGGDDE
jgi:hypothetical protein